MKINRRRPFRISNFRPWTIPWTLEGAKQKDETNKRSEFNGVSYNRKYSEFAIKVYIILHNNTAYRYFRENARKAMFLECEKIFSLLRGLFVDTWGFNEEDIVLQSVATHPSYSIVKLPSIFIAFMKISFLF